MTAEEFRALALALPDASEAEHMRHPDFRVNGKIFATLGTPDVDWGMVKVDPADQLALLAAHPKTFSRAAGAWGEGGSTRVHLPSADVSSVREALILAHAFVVRSAAKRPKTARRKA